MVHTLVRIPMSLAQARAWQADGRPVGSRSTGYAITPELLAAFDLSDPDEAEEVSREIAGISGALAHGERCVVVAECEIVSAADEADFGAVSVELPDWTRVLAVFLDDPADASAVAALASLAPLSHAWELPQIQDVIAQTHLLWHGPTERL